MLSGEQTARLAAGLCDLFEAEELLLQLAAFSRDLFHELDTHGSYRTQSHNLVVLLDRRGLVGEFHEYLKRVPELRDRRAKLERLFRGAATMVPALVDERCPYPGLLAFDLKDAEVFFGRDVEIDELLERVPSRRWISVEGPSGVGKSSLVRAGLLPSLPSTWTVLKMRPGTHPWDSLVDALWSALPDGQRPDRAAFRVDTGGLRHFVAMRSQRGLPTLLFVDQLEELQTFADRQQAEQFSRALWRVLTEDGLSFCLMTTIRSDQVESLVKKFSRLGTLLNRPWTVRYVVAPMEAEALLSAITEPAHRRGVRLEPGLAEQICDDALSHPGESPGGSLPLVAHLLRELWFRCLGKDGLTHAAYRKLEGVEGR